MSVAEINPGSSGDPQFDRTPPQDIAAEQSVLGGMLLSKDAIADVVEVLRSGDFYRPAHGLVYDTILDLYGRGEPADAVTVAAELTRRGEIAKAGGAPYLHTLIASVPTAANAGYYATIVAEQAILRRLVVAGTRIVQMGYRPDADVDDIVDRAQAEVYEVTERRTSEDFVSLGMILPGTLDEIEAISSHDGGLAGVPTGFKELDDLTNGLHPGQMIVVAARPAVGKALALDTPLPTPDGWTTMGEVKVGDYLIDADGKPTRVVAATDVMRGRPCYEVEFSDGTVIVADAQHQWLTETRAARKSKWAAALGYNRVRNQRVRPSVVTTEEIASTVRCAGREARLNHAVALSKPLDLPWRDLPIGPYSLGTWLGDGTSAEAHYMSVDPEIAMRIEGEGYVVTTAGTPMRYTIKVPKGRPGSFKAELRELGVLNSKHIPAIYLRAGELERRWLLAGLMDTDGTVMPSGALQYSSTSRRLAEDVRELIHTLGYRTGWTEKPVRGRSPESSIAYTISFSTDDQIFMLERKNLAHKQRGARKLRRRDTRFIVAVRPVESVPVRCVEVDNPAHLYLASRSFIPTHNSTLGMDIVRSCSIKNNMASVFFSLEMGRTEITMRLLSAESRIPLHHMRTGNMSDEDWAKLARRMGEVAEAPLFIDDSPNLTMMEIRAKARRLKQRHDLKLVVVDYLQLMTSGKRVESRQQEVAEFSRSLKLLAKELEVPVIALSQLNRGPEQRTDKKPMLSDLRESGCLPASTLILRADNGQQASLGELFASGATDVPVWSLDDSLRYVRRHLTHVFSTGIREVFTLTLASGKQVRATSNHPFLTYDGWRALADLEVGGRIAVPRHVPAPETETSWSDDRVPKAARSVALHGVPDAVFSLPKRQIRAFLREVWSGRDSVDFPSRATAESVSRLLLRFGISVTVTETVTGGRPAWTVAVAEDADDRARFAAEIEQSTPFAERARESSAVGTGSEDLWRQLREAAAPVMAAPGSAVGVLPRVAAVLDDSDLELLATNDVLWDVVVSVEPAGVEEVYDATVLGTHNFIADGVVVHNSIEQDADMVILLHREDLYEKESPRAGEADFIVAKHRNGPTKTVTVAFQGHYSRFVDMQQS